MTQIKLNKLYKVNCMKINHPYNLFVELLLYNGNAMNQKEWKKSGKFPGKHEWYNKTRKIQKSLKYNSNPESKVIHHLRDTEEQRKYNDEHYEFWGFNQDGTFEYGKYVIFLTKEEHTEVHKCSEETIKKKLENQPRGINHHLYGKHQSDEVKEKLRLTNLGKHHSEETCKKISEHNAKSMLGKHHTDETKQKLREANLGKHHSEVSKQSISNTLKGIKRSDETKKKICLANKDKVLSQETRDKVSNSVSKIMTPEHRNFISQRTKESMTDEIRAKCSKAQKERFANMTEEEKLAFNAKCKEVSNCESVISANSIAHKELWQNEEYRQKQIASHTGKSVTEETKEKCRKNSLALWQNEEYRKKVSDALKAKGHTKEHDDKVRESRRQMSEDYKKYKAEGGELKWNDYQKWYKENNK